MKCKTLFTGANQKKYFKTSSVDLFSFTVQLACVIIVSVNIL